MKLSLRIFLYSIFVIFILLFGVYFIVSNQIRSKFFADFEDSIEKSLVHLSSEISPYVYQGVDPLLRKQVSYALSLIENSKGLAILDSQAKPVILFSIEKEEISQKIYENVKNLKITKLYDFKSHLYYYGFPLFSRLEESPKFYILLTVETFPVEESIRKTISDILIYVFLILLLSAILLYFFIAREIVYPLERLTEFINSHDPSIEEESFILRKDEIGELSRSFLQLNRNLERIIKEQKEVINSRTKQLSILLKFLTSFNLAQDFEDLIEILDKRIEENFEGKIEDKVIIDPWNNKIIYKDSKILKEEEIEVLLEYIVYEKFPNILTEKILSNFFPSLPSVFNAYILRRKNKVFGFWLIKTENLSPEIKSLLISIANHFTIALENILIYEQTKKLSITDSLTGVMNKRRLEEVLDFELKRSIRYSHPLSIVFIDIDHFKVINDTHGHLMGDAFLKELAIFLVRNLRGTDYVGRFGGEEFVLILTETDIDGAIKASEKLKKRWLESKHVVEIYPERKIGTLSMGISNYPDHGNSMEDLIRFADRALYEAKRERNKILVFKKEML